LARADRETEASRSIRYAVLSSFRILTRLYAAVAKVNIHPTRSSPRCLVFRIDPTVFSQPKISSTFFRHR
jgi:hypothetical protein